MAVPNATTIIVNNIPEQYKQEYFLANMINQGFDATHMDFFYLPMNFRTYRGHALANRGYAYINFRTAGDAANFIAAFRGLHLTHYGDHEGGGQVEVAPAAAQGFNVLCSTYAEDVLRIKTDRYRPMIF